MRSLKLVNRIIVCVGVVLIGLIITSCKPKKHTEVRPGFALLIFSPYNCQYEFSMRGRVMHVEGNSIEFNVVDNQIYDTVKQLQEWVVSDSLSSITYNYVSALAKQLRKDNRNVSGSIYTYRLYVDNQLYSNGLCCNDSIRNVLSYFLQYVDEKQIACCDFFEMIKQ